MSDEQKDIAGIVRNFDPIKVQPFEEQPRKRPRGIRALADSIAAIGQLTPGKVSMIETVSRDAKYHCKLVDGERRLRACLLIGHPFQAVVVRCHDDEERFAMSFAANFNKQDHDAVEIAHALKRLTDRGVSQRDIAAMAGKSTMWVNQHLQIFTLNPAVIELMIPEDGRRHVPLHFALELRELEPFKQKQIADQYIAGKLSKVGFRATITRVKRDAGMVKRGTQGMTTQRLAGMASNYAAAVGRYAAMPAGDFLKMIDGANDLERNDIARSLDMLAADATGLAKLIRSRCKLKVSA